MLDPDGQRMWRWDSNIGNLVPTDQLEIGTHFVDAAEIWSEFDKAVQSAQGD